MKKVLFLSAVLAFASCKKEAAENPDHNPIARAPGNLLQFRFPILYKPQLQIYNRLFDSKGWFFLDVLIFIEKFLLKVALPLVVV